MNKEDFTKIMVILGGAYNKQYTNDEVNVYYNFLKGYDISVVKKAIKNIIETQIKAPNIAQIIREIKRICIPELLYSPNEEWDNVLYVLRNFGYYKEQEAMDYLKPITRECVQSIGWYRLCMSERIEWERKLFVEIFENKQASIEHNQQYMIEAVERLKLENKGE